MNELIENLKQTNLFSGIEPQEIDGLLHCLSARYLFHNQGLSTQCDSPWWFICPVPCSFHKR